MISVVILTRNEEQDLPDCLRSAAWCDDVHVLDSFSTDQTAALAAAAGARVTQRAFDGYASQRNAGLNLPSLRHPWVLFLDADERVPGPLAREMAAAVAGASTRYGAFRMRRRDHFMGRWLKHAQLSPYFVRLLRRGAVTYEREVNEVAQVRGETGSLHEPFDHYPFSKGIAHWIEKHNRYSTMEAALVVAARSGETSFSLRQALFERDFNVRRVHQKELFYRLPARPLLKLAYMLVVRRAFLDGRAGITYALLQAVYEWFIVLKSRELLRARKSRVTEGQDRAEELKTANATR